MIIAIDFDNCIARVNEPILQAINRENGTNYVLEDLRDYPQCFEKLGLKKEFFNHLRKLHRSHYLEFVDSHTLKVLKWLDRHPDVDGYVLTGNHPDACNAIRAFIQMFGLSFRVESSYGGTKDEHIWDVLVDDDPNIVNFNRQTILYRKPWNAHVKHEYHPSNWDEVREILEVMI